MFSLRSLHVCVRTRLVSDFRSFFLPCSLSEVVFIIYLHAKLNPRLGLTYLSLHIQQLCFLPHFLSSSQCSSATTLQQTFGCHSKAEGARDREDDGEDDLVQ